jgi:signal transduction histidine kinase
VEFAAFAVPVDIPRDVALCLFRILQEALRNVVRHSEATSARVELTGTADTLHLVVSDSGRGFDAAAAGSATGLGLLSMRERASLLDGSIAVHSRRGEGTRVAVTIPLSVRDAPQASELLESTAKADGRGV